MDVGVRELKQRLSEYLARVAQGETIRVTDRGRPKALLCPILEHGAVDRGLAAGWLTGAVDSDPPKPVRRAQALRRALDVLREDRDGR